MSPGSPTPDLIKQTAETVGSFIQWIAELIRRRNWFMLLVLLGVVMAVLGRFFRDWINTNFLAEAVQGAFWASFWTGVVLIFVGALVVAVITMPRPSSETPEDITERKAIKGLRPFSQEDAEVFARLQRTSSLRECCQALTSPGYKFGILMGESGCGKTSFLQAGLLPRLNQENTHHRAVYVRFSDQDPLETIRKAIAEQLELPIEWLEPAEPDLGKAFVSALTQVQDGAATLLVLLFDQFEQVFVHNPRKDDRAPFVQAMTAWYKTLALDSVKVLVSIRSDLLHELYELHESLQYSLGPQDLFKLERFTPREATEILGVIAETEQLDFDPRFVEELADRELAHRESGTISPVDLQILAWMIERQRGEDMRAFNRTAFQKFGGVEGLLSRFLERTLDARVLPQQRDAAVKTLLALTDLDRQVRAGVLTVAELQETLRATAKPEDVAEAVGWLSRGDVRLITPQEKAGKTGYELAHERLIPSLMRLADKELTAADKANQLLERRVNEWLGNQRTSRYLLSLPELWQIRRQWPYLKLGGKRQQKERLIQLSQRQYAIGTSVVSVLLIGGLIFQSWLTFTPMGQIQQVRWELSRQIDQISLSADIKTEVALSLIRDNQIEKGFTVIDTYLDSQQSQTGALAEVADIAVRIKQPELLQRTLETAQQLTLPGPSTNALRAVANAYGVIDNADQATQVLEQALTASESIDNPGSRASALSAIANAIGERAALDINKGYVLMHRLATLREPSLLGDIARFYASHGDWGKALRSLQTAGDTSRMSALATILTYYAEQNTPQLIDGPIVLDVESVEETREVKLRVTIQSPEVGCDRHADWWEVLTEEGKLRDRHLIDGPHEFEKEFTTEQTITNLDPNQPIIIRAHFSDDIDREDSINGVNIIDRYPNQAMKGIPRQPDSFKSIRLPARFAIGVEDDDPQPTECSA